MNRLYSGTRKETIPLKFMDFWVDCYAKYFYKKRPKKAIAESPIILIASLGHLGDALTTSYLFPLIRKKYPLAQIDFLTADWNKAVVQHNPYLRNIYYINHFRTNRRNISIYAKILDFYRTFITTKKAIKTLHYDYYFDIRYTDAVAHFILPFTHVNKAFGFSRRGFGGLLTTEFEIPAYDEFHHFEMNLMLLKELGIEADLQEIQPYFDTPANITPAFVQQKIGLGFQNYYMIFPETGASKKELSLDFWHKIIMNILENTTNTLVFCGQTKVSNHIIQAINPLYARRMLDASSKISIDEIALLSQKAQYVICLDSFPAHLACIFTKTILLYKVTGYPFFPFANYPTLLIHGHQPSRNMAFPRSEVEIHYQNPFESPQTIALIEKTLTQK